MPNTAHCPMSSNIFLQVFFFFFSGESRFDIVIFVLMKYRKSGEK